MMVNLFVSVVNMSITASVIAIMLVLLRFLLRQFLPPSFCYLLWGTVFFRLLIPVSIPAKYSILNLVQKNAVPTTAPVYMVTMDYIESGYLPIQSTDTRTFYLILTSLWLFGVVLLLLYTVLINFYIYRKTQTAFISRGCNEVLAECKQLTRVHANVKVYLSAAFDTPVVVGAFHPKIILPSFMDLDNRSALVHIITHELIHIKRFDTVLKKLAAVTLVVHWFNPFIWLFCRQFDRDIETSCDEKVLFYLGESQKKGYANSLVELCAHARNFWSIAAPSFGETAIKNRVSSAINYKRLSKYKTALLYSFVIVIGLVTSTNAVAVSGGYTPVHYRVSQPIQTRFELATIEVCSALSKGDAEKLLSLSQKNDAYYLPFYRHIEQSPIMVEGYKLYPQSDTLAYCYLKASDDTTYTAVLIFEDNEVKLEQLTPTPTFEAAMSTTQTEPVRFIENLHRFGITAGFSNPATIPRPNIAQLCIDEEYRDRVKRGEISPNTTYLPTEWIEQAAKDYFGLEEFSYTFDEELYDTRRGQYIYSPHRGETTQATVIGTQTQGDYELVTAQFYKDPLHMVVDTTVTYTLKKKE